MDVRIIAATNRNLEKALSEGHFREDLYYRLKVVTISLPPLRERSGDIPLLAEYFLARSASDLGMNNPGLTKEAISTLNDHSWPGNVREMGNTLQKALIFNRGAPVRPKDIAQAISGMEVDADKESETTENALNKWIHAALTNEGTDNLFESCVDRFSATLISEALNLTGGNRSRAAKLLGLSRPTLHSKIEKFGLKIETSVSGALVK